MTLQPLEAWRADVGYLAGALVLFEGRSWIAARSTQPGERPGDSQAWVATTGQKPMPANPMLAGRR